MKKFRCVILFTMLFSFITNITSFAMIIVTGKPTKISINFNEKNKNAIQKIKSAFESIDTVGGPREKLEELISSYYANTGNQKESQLILEDIMKEINLSPTNKKLRNKIRDLLSNTREQGYSNTRHWFKK